MSGRGRPRTAKGSESKLANGAQTPKRDATSTSGCTQKDKAKEKPTCISNEQAAKKKQKQTQEKIPGDNGAELLKKTQQKRPQCRARPPDLNHVESTTGAQVQHDVNDSTRGARQKTKAVRAKSPEEEVVEANDSETKNGNGEMKQLSLEVDKKADAARKREPSKSLNATLDTLKIRMSEKSKASEVINRIEEVILEHLKSETLFFKEVEKTLHTGSYYENLKISNPDEFDIMFPIPVPRVDIEPFSDDGAFYSASLKRGYSPLRHFVSESQLLPASEILQEFRKEVIKSIHKFPGVDIDKKKKGCPAVTLNVEVDSSRISLDIVLCLVVQSSWPTFTKDGLKIEGWLGRKVKLKYKYVPYYLVPKYEGKGTEEINGVLAKDAWRVSFSHVEKDILKNHGSEKTCCEKDGARCCRKDCLKLLKHLLSLLKKKDKSFDKFCSYHAKTTLLHACCSRNKDSQWAAADLSQCFDQLLKDFEDHLERQELNNFFIPAQNLLARCSKKSCKSLALLIKEQREEGFPIFKL